MISNDVENLEYLQKKLDYIEEYIQSKVVGIDDIVTKEAVNEKQMDGAFESKTNVLLNIKTNLDEVYVWIAKTVCRIIANGSPVTVQANFGTEWYLVSEDEMQERLSFAIEKGFPREEIEMIYGQLIDTKYKGNPDKVKRLKIMNRVDPCPFDNFEGKKMKLELGIISKQEFIISERLITFARRFEALEGSITDFGKELEPRVVIEKIYEQFKKYADEQANDSAEPTDGGTGADG